MDHKLIAKNTNYSNIIVHADSDEDVRKSVNVFEVFSILLISLITTKHHYVTMASNG